MPLRDGHFRRESEGRSIGASRFAIAALGDYDGAMEPSFDHMTRAERILYVQDLWDRIAAEPDPVPLTDAQRLELRRRVEEHRADPGLAVSWEQVLERARQGTRNAHVASVKSL